MVRGKGCMRIGVCGLPRNRFDRCSQDSWLVADADERRAMSGSYRLEVVSAESGILILEGMSKPRGLRCKFSSPAGGWTVVSRA